MLHVGCRCAKQSSTEMRQSLHANTKWRQVSVLYSAGAGMVMDGMVMDGNGIYCNPN